MTDWADVDVDDDQEAELLGEWRAVQDHSPMGVITVDVPKAWAALAEECQQ